MSTLAVILIAGDGQAELTWVAGYMPKWSPIPVLTWPDVEIINPL